MAENMSVKLNNEDFKTPLKTLKNVSKALSDSSNTPVTPLAAKKKRTLTIPPSPFLQKLGCGTGVNVFLMNRPVTPSGSLKSPWAIKRLNKRIVDSDSEDTTYEERLNYEAHILKEIKHENIVGYRDVVRGVDGRLSLCMESGEKSLGYLREERRDEELGPFSPKQIHKVIRSVTNALTYLHNTKNLLHADLKSYNILVKGDFLQIKLCDFGVCLKLKPDLQGLADEMDHYCGTPAWTSKEVLEEELVTDRADIYSLGCVIFEMIALGTPHIPPLSFDDESGEESFWDEEAFENSLGSVPALPDSDYDKAYHPYIALMTICCREDQSRRPSAEEILSTVDSLTN